MLYAQRRWWADHPRIETLAAAYFRLPQKKTPPGLGELPSDDAAAVPQPVDWSWLDPGHPLFAPRARMTVLGSEGLPAPVPPAAAQSAAQSAAFSAFDDPRFDRGLAAIPRLGPRS